MLTDEMVSKQTVFSWHYIQVLIGQLDDLIRQCKSFSVSLACTSIQRTSKCYTYPVLFYAEHFVKYHSHRRAYVVIVCHSSPSSWKWPQQP